MLEMLGQIEPWKIEVIIIAFIIFTNLSILLLTGSILFASLTSIILLGAAAWLGLIPIWLVLIYTLITGALLILGGGFNVVPRMQVSALIGMLMAIIVSVVMFSTMSSLLQEESELIEPTETPTVETYTEPISPTPTEQPTNGAFLSMAKVLPILFAVMTTLMVIRMVGGVFWGGRRRTTIPNSKELIRRITMMSIQFENYFSKIDEIIGIKSNRVPSIQNDHNDGLMLDRKTNLMVISNEFNWYITDKHENHDMFKIVGLHKSNRALNVVYILGKDSHIHQPYLIRIPPEYIEKNCKECAGWAIGIDANKDSLTEI